MKHRRIRRVILGIVLALVAAAVAIFEKTEVCAGSFSCFAAKEAGI